MIIFISAVPRPETWHLPVALQQRSLKWLGKWMNAYSNSNASQSLPIKICSFIEGCLKYFFLPVYVLSLGPNLIWFPGSLSFPVAFCPTLSRGLISSSLLLGTYQEALFTILHTPEPWSGICHVLYLPTPLPANPDLAQFSVLWYSTYMDLLLNWIAFSHFLVGSIISSPWTCDSFYFFANLCSTERRKKACWPVWKLQGRHSALSSFRYTHLQPKLLRGGPAKPPRKNWHSQAFTLQEK